MTAPTVRLSAFVLTKNESRNLPACLETLRECCDDLYIVDSCSTDDTAEIAIRYGATIVQHAFEGHTRQRMWALRNLPFRHEWVIALDADHRITPELRAELRELFASPPTDLAGFFVKRRQIFRGKWIRHGGYYPKHMLKVFRHALARLDDDEFDYRFYVDGPTASLKHDILEANENEWSVSFFVEKHNRFSIELATEEIRRERSEMSYFVRPSPLGNPDQRTLWMKTIWRRVPLYVRPWLMFSYRYLFRLGFLDGKEGLIFHFLQTLWFRTLVDIRIDEMRGEESGKSHLPVPARIAGNDSPNRTFHGEGQPK